MIVRSSISSLLVYLAWIGIPKVRSFRNVGINMVKGNLRITSFFVKRDASTSAVRKEISPIKSPADLSEPQNSEPSKSVDRAVDDIERSTTAGEDPVGEPLVGSPASKPADLFAASDQDSGFEFIKGGSHSNDLSPIRNELSAKRVCWDVPGTGSLFNCPVSDKDATSDVKSPKFDPKLFSIERYTPKVPPSNDGDSLAFVLMSDILGVAEDLFCTGKGSRKTVCILLANFFRVLICHKPSDIVASCYILLNKIGPDHESEEVGVGDSIIIKAMTETYSKTEQQIKKLLVTMEDLGGVAANCQATSQTLFKLPDITIKSVLSQFIALSASVGKASKKQKVDIIKKMLFVASREEAKYIIRFLQQKLRIGINVNTVIQCLADAFYLTRRTPTTLITDIRTWPTKSTFTLEDMELAVKEASTFVPSFDKIVQHLLDGDDCEALLRHCRITPGIPVKPMLAKGVTTVKEIIQGIGEGVGFTCEYKYDGERVQVHLEKGGSVRLYSRNMENLSDKYPDVIELFKGCVKEGVEECILDTEVVAVNREEGKILSFQLLSTRKRKNVVLENIKVEVCIFPFDILYVNGESLVKHNLMKRRERLYSTLNEKPFILQFAKKADLESFDDIDEFLRQAIADSCEGLMIKSLGDEATYEPQKRSNNWLKFKKDYIEGLGDSVDLVPIGAFYGKGKRTSLYGSYLLAVYDEENALYKTVCKTGTGFTDVVLRQLYETMQDNIITSKPADYVVNEKLEPDVWFKAAKVWECKAADLSISPIHAASQEFFTGGKGVGLRFPRFLRERDDKKPQEATTSLQIYEMYQSQFNK